MGPSETRVIVEQPMDWVSAVAIPVAAILVSSLIAVWVASLERRANDRAHVRQAAVSVVRELGALRTAAAGEGSAWVPQLYSMMLELNSFSAVLPSRDVPVAQFVGLVVVHAGHTGDAENVRSTATWLMTAIENWLRGDLPSRAFRASMPPDPDNVWTASVDPSDWSRVTTGKIRL